MDWKLTWDFSTKNFAIAFTESVSPAEMVNALKYLEREQFRHWGGRLTTTQPDAAQDDVECDGEG